MYILHNYHPLYVNSYSLKQFWFRETTSYKNFFECKFRVPEIQQNILFFPPYFMCCNMFVYNLHTIGIMHNIKKHMNSLNVRLRNWKVTLRCTFYSESNGIFSILCDHQLFKNCLLMRTYPSTLIRNNCFQSLIATICRIFLF